MRLLQGSGNVKRGGFDVWSLFPHENDSWSYLSRMVLYIKKNSCACPASKIRLCRRTGCGTGRDTAQQGNSEDSEVCSRL